MRAWPKLTHAPVVEALIDIHVERAQSVTLEGIRACTDALAAEFPSREEIRQFTGQFSFSLEGGQTFAAQAPAPIGIMLRSADGKWAAQFRLDGFTVSRLEPYTSWDELKARANSLWAKYSAVAQPQKIVRVATRFINRITLPPGESFDKTFATTFDIAASLPQAVASFLLRVVIPFPDESAMAVVTQTLPENSQDCTFDLDAFAVVPQGISEGDAWTKLEQLRSVKNRLFFDSLTAEAIGRFG
ncbi:MAG: TIGR04255 family protein [Phycisphaerales bacterium]|nr:TIGR04255 family protein [Phycisphaerales bacterium]